MSYMEEYYNRLSRIGKVKYRFGRIWFSMCVAIDNVFRTPAPDSVRYCEKCDQMMAYKEAKSHLCAVR